MSDNIRFDIPQSEIPTAWYNIQADLPRPLPPVLHPGTKQPVGQHPGGRYAFAHIGAGGHQKGVG